MLSTSKKPVECGAPWKIVGSFLTFADAQAKKAELKGPGKALKIFRRARAGEERFQLRYRDQQMITEYKKALEKEKPDD